jgi:hypothetical protein
MCAWAAERGAPASRATLSLKIETDAFRSLACGRLTDEKMHSLGAHINGALKH